MADEPRPSERPLEEQIRFTTIALKMTEKYAGEDWAEEQADRLTIELVKLESEKKKQDAQLAAANELISDEDFRKMIKKAAPTKAAQRQFAIDFGVSIPTVERWADGRNSPGTFMRPHIKKFIAEQWNPPKRKKR